jgi:hypothetical protein
MGVDSCWCCDGYGYYREYYTVEKINKEKIWEILMINLKKIKFMH